MPKKVIMHLLQSNKYSGAESVVCQIIEMFADLPDYEMVYVSPRGPIEQSLKQKGIMYFGLTTYTQKEIDRAVREINPNIIHAHDFNASVRAIKYKRKTISHLHSNPPWFSKVDPRTLLYTICLRHYKFVIGVSNSIIEEYLFSKLLIPKYMLLPNVVDAEKVLSLAVQDCNQTSDLLFVGRFSRPKNPIGFLEIVRMIKRKKSDIKALMIGEGPLFNECKRIIVDDNLEDNIKLLGFEENPYKYMANTKVLVIPSVYEGFGLVAVEAMILGVPVVCTAVGGLLNIVDKDCGYLSNDIKDLSDKALKLIMNQKLRQLKGEKSKEKTIRFCNINYYKKILKKIYEETLQ